MVPYRRESPPDGILDQLAWWGVGGYYAESHEATENCPHCSVNGSLFGIYAHNNQVTFRGFYPNQVILLSIYEFAGEDPECEYSVADFLAFRSVEMSADGSRTVTFTGNLDAGLMIGDIYDAHTGELLMRVQGRKSVNDVKLECEQWNNAASSTCSNASPQQLQIGDKAYVCTANAALRLRDAPGTDSDTIRSFMPGTNLDVIDGPVCVDDWYWWKVRMETGDVGWMAEGGDSIDPYFICPKK